MKAGVKKDSVIKKGQEIFRVVDLDQEDKPPIMNNSGEPIDGGGHRKEGISEMLAEEVNESLRKRGLLSEK
jgi:hypothetical protein